jgi:hypothetical protein
MPFAAAWISIQYFHSLSPSNWFFKFAAKTPEISTLWELVREIAKIRYIQVPLNLSGAVNLSDLQCGACKRLGHSSQVICTQRSSFQEDVTSSAPPT